MKYYIIEGGEKTGPFTIEELDKKDLFKDSLVWTKGLEDWTEARHIPMLKKILDETPPIFKREKETPPPTNNVTVSSSIPHFGYMLASRWERFIASIISSLIILLPALILTNGNYIEGDDYFSFTNILTEIVIAIIIGGLMYPLWSGNLGHKIFGLKVVSSDKGEDINSPMNGILREILKSFLSYLIIPVIWLLWDKDKQNLYDKIIKTIVVKKK